MKKCFSLSVVLLLSCSSNIGCDSASTQLELNACASDILLEQESQLASLIEKIPQEINDSELFIASTKSWESYRSRHCESVAHIYYGGSLYDYYFVSCKAAVTARRIEAIKNDYQDTVNIISQGQP